MASASLASVEKATTGRDRSVTRSGPNGHYFRSVMRHARDWWRNKTINDLAVILDCEPRSVARYLRGDRTPDADAAFALLFSDKGHKVFEVAVATLPARKQVEICRELERAAKRRRLNAERMLLDEKIRQAEVE